MSAASTRIEQFVEQIAWKSYHVPFFSLRFPHPLFAADLELYQAFLVSRKIHCGNSEKMGNHC